MNRRTAVLIAIAMLAVLGVALVVRRPPLPRAPSSSLPSASSPTAASPTLNVGDEVFSVAPDAVRGIDYETRSKRVEAVRVSDDGLFELTERDPQGNVGMRCRSGKAWDGMLTAISSLRVVRSLSQGDASTLWARLSPDAATLRVRDTFVAEPSEFQVATSNGEVIVRDASGVFVASLPARVLDVLAAGCH